MRPGCWVEGARWCWVGLVVEGVSSLSSCCRWALGHGPCQVVRVGELICPEWAGSSVVGGGKVACVVNTGVGAL